jgi:hypothetical protein
MEDYEMRNRILSSLSALAIACAFALANSGSVAAQGKGHGSGRGSAPGGPPAGAGVDRGIDRSSDASMGRADTGRGNASNRSNGRSDAGLDRARVASENLRAADNELKRHPDLATDLRLNANDLRAGYQVALQTNPNLTFGQYVAATRLAHNFGGTNPNITRDAILAGLANGHSLGRTLQDLGLNKDEAKAAVKQADMQNKPSKHRN